MLVHSKDNNDPEGIEKEQQAYAASKKLLPHLFEGCADDVLYEPQIQNNNEVDNLQTKKDENRLRYKELLGNVSAVAKLVANRPFNPVGYYQAVIDNEQNIKNVAKGVKKAAFYAGDVYDENKLGLLDNLREKLNELNSSEKIYDRNTPDSKTFAWATKNWDNAKIAYDVGFIHPKFKNISSNAHRFAKRVEGVKAINKDNNEHPSEINALRHTLWQSAITAAYGSGVATIIGNNHEPNPQMDLSVRKYKDEEMADSAVDLLNNSIGRRIGEQNKGKTIKELSTKVLDEYYNNGLYTLKYSDDGCWHIVKSKLTDEYYAKLKYIYNLADKNGFLPYEDKVISIVDIMRIVSQPYKIKEQIENIINSLYEKFQKSISNYYSRYIGFSF